MALCECKCGGEASPGRRFIKGHQNRGKTLPPQSAETKEKHRIAALKTWQREEYQKSQEEGRADYYASEKCHTHLTNLANNQKPITKETRELQSQRAIARCKNPEYIAKREALYNDQNWAARFSEKQQGKHAMSDENREMHSNRAKAFWQQPGVKEQFSESRLGEKNPMYGKSLTEEHKKKDSEGVKNWWAVPENRAKMDAIHQSEAFRDKMREISLRGKDNLVRSSACHSPGEEAAVLIMDALGIKYERQRWILNIEHKYPADFYFPERNLVIEIDGSWHKKPERQALDAVRGEEMKAQGYLLVRFWDYELDKFEQFAIENLLPKK